MVKQQLTDLILAAVDSARQSGDMTYLAEAPVPTLEAPRSRDHGDYATNVAMTLAKSRGLPPRKVAELIIKHLPQQDLIENAEVAGPGFINFRLNHNWLRDLLRRIGSEGDRYGTSVAEVPLKIQVEFVSANPNGPITVAHGRGGAIGDVLASLLTATGHDVQREFYVNDALNSTQMNNFGRSVHFRYMQQLGNDMGTDDLDWLYRGDYVTDIARKAIERVGSAYEKLDINTPEAIVRFRELAQEGMQQEQAADLQAFGIIFDDWFSENTLHESGAVKRDIQELTDRGFTYELDGALWLKSTLFGDDKDRVLIRADGSPTYIAGDVSYHKAKLERFDRAIDVWGADHGGYIARTKAAVAANGYDPERVYVLLFQLVRIMKNGELVRSSKRRGNVLELRADLIDEIGKDAARFFFLSRSSDTSLDIDMDLAREQSSKNPVYYVQYAHARCCTVLEKATFAGINLPSAQATNLTVLTTEQEMDVIKKLGDWPEEVAYSASSYAPHRLTHYLRDLAGLFHTFYDAGNNESTLRVLCDVPEQRDARLVLVSCVKQVLSNALSILGISAPVRM
jgi:arginyl-tRNA synthetase